MLKQSAFTLLEVMVSLLVVSVSLGALMLAKIETYKATDYLRDKTFTLLIAQNVQNKIRLGIYPVNQIKQITYANKKWKIKTSYGDLDQTRLKKITINISSVERNNNEFKFDTYVITKI